VTQSRRGYTQLRVCRCGPLLVLRGRMNFSLAYVRTALLLLLVLSVFLLIKTS